MSLDIKDKEPIIQEPESEDEMLNRFKQDIINDADAVENQRDAAEEDMRFLNVIGGMWEGFFERELENRVKLQFPIIGNFLNRVQAEWNQNRVGVEYKPGDDMKTSDNDAELLNGIHRADFRRRGSGKKAIDNAVLEVINCGYGCYELGEDFIDTDDPENDLQRIEWRSIFNAYNTVFWEDASQMIDKSDARRCTKLKRFTRKSFLAEFPDNSPVSAYEPHNRNFDNFITNQADGVFVATRYEIIEEDEIVFIYNNLVTGEVQTYPEERHKEIEDELKKIDFLTKVRERKFKTKKIMKSVFNGDSFLEKPRRISGQFIPVIPVFGHRIYVGGTEWYKGFVRDLKDASRLLNQQLSQLSENASGNGADKPILDPDQVQGDPAIMDSWANPTNKSYFLLNALRDEDGKIVQAGPLGYVKPAQLDGSTAGLLNMVPQLIQQFTGSAPQETVDPDRSGKAIKEARKIQDLTTQPVMENIASAIEWSGVVYASKAAELYTTPRIIRTIGKDGSESTIQLMKLVPDEETGKLIESNTLDRKKFRAFADIGPQYETLRQETTDTALQMIDTLAPIPGAQAFIPELVGVAIENMTGTGLESIKKLNRKIRLLQGTIEPQTDEDKQMILEAQQAQANQADPQAELLEAVKGQQEAEARNLDAATIEKGASAVLKQAQAQKTLADIETSQAKTLADIRSQVFQNVQSLPI